MNHSIYSADRLDPSEDCGRSSRCRHRFGRPWHHGAVQVRMRVSHQTARANVIKAGKPVVITSSGRVAGSLRSFDEFSGIHAALYQPPKVASWICRRPQPQVDYRKRPPPTGAFSCLGCAFRSCAS